MTKRQWILIGLSGLVIAALAGGMLLFANTGSASASSAVRIAGLRSLQALADDSDLGRLRGGDQRDAYLAEALGISEEALQTARENAFKAAVQQALDAGLITQSQAERLLDAPRFPRIGLGALLVGPDSGIDMNVLLAAELKISVEELQAAREKAVDLGWEQAIADGKLSEEQVELIKARRALQGEFNFHALALEALGLTQEKIDTYRQERMDRDAILKDLGMTAEEAKAAVRDVFEVAINEAVDAGTITQAQADLLLAKLDENILLPFGGLRSGMRPKGPAQMKPGGMMPDRMRPDGGLFPKQGEMPGGGFFEGGDGNFAPQGTGAEGGL